MTMMNYSDDVMFPRMPEDIISEMDGEFTHIMKPRLGPIKKVTYIRDANDPNRVIAVDSKMADRIMAFIKEVAETDARIQEIRDIVADIKYLDWEFMVRMDGNRPYLQIKGNGPDPCTGGNSEWTSRKWWLSPHMCTNEIVRTAYAALHQAVKHEMDENFTYQGVPINDPHMNLNIIVEAHHNRPDFQETRDDGMQGV